MKTWAKLRTFDLLRTLSFETHTVKREKILQDELALDDFEVQEVSLHETKQANAIVGMTPPRSGLCYILISIPPNQFTFR